MPATVTRRSAGIRGAKELSEMFRALPRKIANKLLADTVKAGAIVIQQSIKRLTPVGRTGKLKRSVRHRKGKSRSPLEARRTVGPTAPHAHLVEFGHALVWKQPTTGRKYVKGHVPAHPFVRPGFDAGAPGAVRAIADHLGRLIPPLAVVQGQ